MGIGVSNWRLARAVSMTGELGVVSGTALDQSFCRRLQDGDPGGHLLRVLKAFPFQNMARAVLDRYYIPDGKPANTPYKRAPLHTPDGSSGTRELCILSNFAEVMLAREGHDHPIGINYLEKIQMPHLPSIYGAMLAGAAVIIAGAGIPLDMPLVIDRLGNHLPAQYPLQVTGLTGYEKHIMEMNPKAFWESEEIAPLRHPDFLPIVSTEKLAKLLLKRSKGSISGFIVETSTAGGHNAPPRGGSTFDNSGQPVYGPRDAANLESLQELDLPFWLGGSYASPERLHEALEAGAQGIQVGSLFALCTESGLVPGVRKQIIKQIFSNSACVFTDPHASPTGFPFKVAQLEGTLSERSVYENRKRVCDLGYLREAYIKEDGSIGFRCSAEPEKAYTAKGGDIQDTEGSKCLCNALLANIGLPQHLSDGSEEKCLITLGDDLSGVKQLCTAEHPDFSAADVIKLLRSKI